jgi:predicted transcriptional regulator
MSRAKSKKVDNFIFVERFIEVCDSSQPADIARLLNISYQAAKNYLEGRLPDSGVLLAIAEQTDYSIHWLLTGQGDKFAQNATREDTLLLSGKFREFVRRECKELINEVLSNQFETAQQKTVVLKPGKIKEEKVMDEAATFSGKQQ